MRDKHLLYLVVSYVLVIVSFLIFGDTHALLRSSVLSSVFTIALIVHILISRKSHPTKLFYVLSFLWGIKWVVFVSSTGINTFFRRTYFLLETFDLFILLAIAVLVSISLILRRPFGYKKTESKVYILFGVIGLICSGWIALIAVPFSINVIKMSLQ